jgi:hypothetical protein
MWLESLFRSRPVERVDIDDAGVVRHMVDGREERIAWKDLAAVRVITTSDGPSAEDLFVCLEADDGGGCAIPNALAAPLMGYLTRLPGFDVETLMRAFASTRDAHFVCWRRPQ